MFSVAFIFAVGPEPNPVLANVVPLPIEVAATDLEAGSGPTDQYSSGGAATRDNELVASVSQRRVVQVQGRSLSLSMMRADRMGLAVLSVPKRSVIASLPNLESDAFRRLVAVETGCRPVGQVQVIGGRVGTLALATGLSCS
ncbi:hypothetical protein [Pseudophaeobacter flagellatus]|uniref:hypothetical protein n=1 Tax=Pseudophaeobacter flagellatus TaxID=2899119 RepID=UPI001E52038E|nr:hypothetical protein [Pseudophaeobacter flagellatus]